MRQQVHGKPVARPAQTITKSSITRKLIPPPPGYVARLRNSVLTVAALLHSLVLTPRLLPRRLEVGELPKSFHPEATTYEHYSSLRFRPRLGPAH